MALNVHLGVPGVFNFTSIYYTLATLAYRGRSWAAREACVASQDVSGELPEALWRRFRTSWGALGGLFGSIFGSEKQFFAISNWKSLRSTIQLDEVYNSCCFKSHLKRIR